jgi:endonuclease/exonuclease/phosphatase family metal-dependent hydrolase
VAWLDLVDADVVCLQEVVENADGRNQADYLAGRTRTAYHVAYAGVPWRDRRFGNAVLSRWPVEDQDAEGLPGSSLEGDIDRLVLHVRSGGLDLFCTHLSWRPDDGALREAQARVAVEFIRRRSDPNLAPPILAGDMNADPESNEIRYLSGLAALDGDSAYFQDAWRLAGGTGAGWTWDNRNPFAAEMREPDRRIDYILVGWRLGSRVWVRRAEVIGDWALTGVHPTDHFGLLAEVARAPDYLGP